MKLGRVFTHAVLWLLVAVMALPPWAFAQEAGGAPSAKFSNEQLEQILAPIALYPDDLIVQTLMASTYPIEVVQADRWVKQNKDLKGDALGNALEKQDWDPSVKSLVNFPQVLSMMSEKLDWTQKLGDAFLGQEKEVMNTVQVLRKKAKDAGNLNTTQEQKVVVEQETIIIQPANPEVVYVPTYNPTVVYGAWPYPAYPPYSYYPPGYVAGGALLSFGVGLALGAAWGNAWGNANWHGGDVNINSNRNVNRNTNRDRVQQRGQGTQGKWQHDASHRKGAAYRDSGTAQKFGQSSSRPTASSREARGFGDSRGAGAQTRDMSGARGGASGGRDSAFSGAGNGGFERSASQRGQSSRSQSFGGSSGGSRGGGGGFSGGGSRGGGGGSRGGGGGGGRGGGGGGRR